MNIFDDIAFKYIAPSMLSTVGTYVLFTSPFVLYILARWRSHREETRDSQLGLKLALGYIMTVGLQVALMGGVALLYAIITKETDDRGDIARFAFGLLVPSVAVYVAHKVMLSRTNEEHFPAVRRLIAGYNLLLVAMLGFIALIVTTQSLFKKGSSGEAGRFAVAALLIYVPAWGFQGWRVFSDRTGAKLPPAPVPPPTREMPSVTPPTVAEPSVTASGTQLPALGGGAFPPINKP